MDKNFDAFWAEYSKTLSGHGQIEELRHVAGESWTVCNQMWEDAISKAMSKAKKSCGIIEMREK